MDSNHRILHDAYFNKKPRLITLLAVRLALLCAMSVSATLMLTDMYKLPCGRFAPAVISACATAVMYLLASLLPSIAAYGGVITVCGVLCFVFKKKIAKLTAMFINYMLMYMDSRLLSTAQFVERDVYNKLKSGVYVSGFANELTAGCLLAITFIAVLFAVVFTASARTRCRVFVPVLFTVLFSVPAFVAEKAGFSPFVILFISAVFAHRSISTSYELDSSFVFNRTDASRRSEIKGERAYRRKTRFWAFSRKTQSDTVRYGKYTSNAVATIIISVAVFSAAVAVCPNDGGFDYKEILDALSDLGSDISNGFGRIWNDVTGRADERNYFSISGALGGSDEISLSAPADSDREVMRVTLDRNDVPVFLRGDIGVTFTGNGWTSVGNEYGNIRDYNGNRYSELLESFYPEEEYQYFRLALLQNEQIPDDVIPLQKVSIEYLRNTRVVFQPLAPYDLDYKESEYFDAYGDFVLRTKRKSGYISTYDSMALTPNLSDWRFVSGGYMSEGLVRYGALFDADQRAHDGDYFGNIGVYRDYIMDTYTRSDEVVSDIMRELYMTDVLSMDKSRYANVSGLCDYFKKNYSYTLDEDESGGNVCDFLYNTKKGHCALFASAMTLCLRSADIPARYVTGYVVTGEGEKTDSGYQYTLCERNLHAWVEVYFTGVGWLPFDPTSTDTGFLDSDEDMPADETEDDGQDMTEITTTVTEETEPAESETEVSETTPNEQGGAAPAEEGGGFPFEYLPFIIIAAVLIILVIGVIMFVKAVNKAERSAFESFRRRPPTEATAKMYRFILLLLSDAGLVPQNELLFDFAKRVDGDITMKGINVFMRDIVGIIEKCEFGTEEIAPVTEDERKAVYKFAAAVYVRTLERHNAIKQFFVKISLFM